jgi:hypothetical protein
VDQLIAAINAYIQTENRSPMPFVWTATVQHILDTVAKAKQALDSLYHFLELNVHFHTPGPKPSPLEPIRKIWSGFSGR